MQECANTENCRQAKIIAVGSTDIVFDKTAIIVHMLEDPGIVNQLIQHTWMREHQTHRLGEDAHTAFYDFRSLGCLLGIPDLGLFANPLGEGRTPILAECPRRIGNPLRLSPAEFEKPSER